MSDDKPFEIVEAMIVPCCYENGKRPPHAGFVVYTRKQLQRDGTYRTVTEWRVPDRTVELTFTTPGALSRTEER